MPLKVGEICVTTFKLDKQSNMRGKNYEQIHTSGALVNLFGNFISPVVIINVDGTEKTRSAPQNLLSCLTRAILTVFGIGSAEQQTDQSRQKSNEQSESRVSLERCCDAELDDQPKVLDGQPQRRHRRANEPPQEVEDSPRAVHPWKAPQSPGHPS